MFVSDEFTHRDGVWWFEAPRPRRLHRCKPQSEGWIGFSFIQRCACGAVRYKRADDGPHEGWFDRNSRRND